MKFNYLLSKPILSVYKFLGTLFGPIPPLEEPRFIDFHSGHIFLVWTLTSICHFFRPTVCLSVALQISGAHLIMIFGRHV